MNYYYFGAKKFNFEIFKKIPISLSLDGLLLYNSKHTQVWSFLISINIPPKQVFPIALL